MGKKKQAKEKGKNKKQKGKNLAQNKKKFKAQGLNAPIQNVVVQTPQVLPKFGNLSKSQRAVFENLTNETLKKQISDGVQKDAMTILSAIESNPKIETLFAKLEDVSHFGTFLTLSTEQVDTFLGIKDDEIRKFAEGLDDTKAKKLLDALKTNAELDKLDKNQIETLTNIADDDLFAHAITLAQAESKKLLDALKTTPELLHVWKVLETTKGDGAKHLAKFLKLDSTEAKNYLEIITGKNDGTATAASLTRGNIKTKLVSLSDDKVKQFLTDFKAADTEKLLALNTKSALIDIWKEVKHIDSTVIATTRNQISFLESIDWLKNTTDGQHVTSHIFVGDLKLKSGVIKGITGVHHKNAMKKQDTSTDTTGDVRATGGTIPLAGGFYQQLVEVYNGTTWKKKIGNGGMASFFPDTWTEEQVLEEIAFAELNAVYQNNINVFITAAPQDSLPISATLKTAGLLVVDGKIATATATTTTTDVTVLNIPFPYHTQGKTHNGKTSAPIPIDITACDAIKALPLANTTNTITFLESTYNATTSNGGKCQMYLYNPGHSSKVIGSAFPCA